MKKLLLFFIIASTVKIQAQVITPLYHDDFESYSVGQTIVQQRPDKWSSYPNRADAPISNEFANSGTKSLKFKNDSTNKFTNSNLAMLNLPDSSNGIYQIKFKLFIKYAFFGGFTFYQDTVRMGGKLYLNGGFLNIPSVCFSSILKNVSLDFNQWNSFNIIVNLDADLVFLEINNKIILFEKWSVGAYGYNSGINRIFGILFGYNSNSTYTDYYYLDDVEINKLILSPPFNLDASLSGVNNSTISWDAPLGATPESYTLYRNGLVHKTGITSTSFSDINLYPRTYHYKVSALYDSLGFSVNSNIDSVAVSGGTKRNLVLLELGTATW